MIQERATIMMVDDDMTTLTMGKNILQTKYKLYTVPSGAKFFELLDKIIPDLILLDIIMPAIDGFEVIKRLKSDRKTADIPVIFLTARNDVDHELEGLSLGAIDYVSKPFSPSLLVKRIENHLLIEAQRKELRHYNERLQDMVNDQTKQIADLQYAVLSAVAELVEFREQKIGGHIGRIQSYLKLMVDALISEKIYFDEISAWNMDFLIPSSQLHDVGKALIPEHIVQKPGKLTVEEFEEMKKHAAFGVWVVERITQHTKGHVFLDHAKIFAGTHHERWDGTGYPEGLKGEEIPLQGRLMAIADVYDALIADRPYKVAISAAEAEKIILAGKGIQFDPVLVDVFQGLASQFANIAAFPDLLLSSFLSE
ncbi:MAG: response regulator [Spirochaetales bacterium]|jgi:putative two-component system response regulator|nr:response regulator [Spirochaetales bacterium]